MFRRTRDGIAIELAERETTFLLQIPSLLESVEDSHDDPGYSVLNRPLCPGDPSLDAELRSLVSGDVESQRVADRSLLERCLSERTEMTIDEAHGFLRSLNEARLVLAAREGAFEEGPAWEERIDTSPALAAVAWLGYVQGELIGVLSANSET